MPDEVFKINLRSGDMEVQFQKAIQRIFAKKTAEQIQKRVATVIDRELGKIFYYTAIDIFQNNFGDIAPYAPRWKRYSKGYAKQKLRRAGHLDMFKYGVYGGQREGEEQLGDELFSISQRDVLNEVGKTQVSISKDNKRIRVTIAPKITRFTKVNMERQFSDLISDNSMHKLQNRKRAYRALIGPEFMYMLNDRIPNAVSNSLARI